MKQILNGLIDMDNPGTFNQAVMELGALVCLPRKPKCEECPLAADCYALRHSMTEFLPVREKARPKKVNFYNYLVFLQKSNGEWFTWLNKRTSGGIWKNLYDFPLIETNVETRPEEILTSIEFIKMIQGSIVVNTPVKMETVRHILSHKDLRVNFLIVEARDFSPSGCHKVAYKDLTNYPVSRLIENFLKKLMNQPGIFSNFPDKQ
jgi:A/G-specific adenine glycosylase